MNKLIIISTLLALAYAAQLPSATYLPQSQFSSAPNPPSATYLPQSQLPSAANPPSSTYLPQSQFSSAANVPSASYQPQSQLHSGTNVPSATYLPQSSGASDSGSYGQDGSHGQDSGNTRAQQAEERNSAILKLDQEIGENGFHYAYETSNGIQGEESGNAAQTRGGFAYKGDDGKIYSVTFTAGEDGYRPQGDHLPVPPPTPEEILLALKQNEKDEAAGIFDDGQYHPEDDWQDKSGHGSSGSANQQGSFNPNSGYSY